MSTQYSEIYSFVRTLLGDSDASSLMYSDDMLKGHINWVVSELDSDNIVGISVDEEFATDLSNKDKVRVALMVALNIIMSQPTEFSYRSPILSVTRKVNSAVFIQHLQNKLADVTGGRFAMSIDTDIDAIINEPWRFLDAIETAIAKPR